MNAINPNNSNNLTSGFGHSNDMNFVKSNENRLGDSNSLSSVELAQLPLNPMYTNGSTAETDVLKANYGIPADECWLFKPPKQHQTQGSVEPIRTWLRAIFDSPDSCFFHSRRNLLSRLEAIILAGGQTEAYQFGGSVPSLNLITSGYPPRPNTCRTEHSVYGSVVSNRLVTASSSDSISFPSQQTVTNPTMNSEHVNMNTFTRSHKPRISLPPQCSASKSVKNGSHNPNSYLSNSTGTNFTFKPPNKTGSCDELETTSANTNVQEIARRQEDTLKAEVAALAAAAAAAGKHGSQHSLASLCRNSPHGSYTNIASAPESPHSSTTKLNQPQQNHDHFYVKQSLSFSQEFEGQITNQQPTQDTHLVNHSSHSPTRKDVLSNIPAHASNVANIKQNPYKILPQKPLLTNIVPEMGDESRQSQKISVSTHPSLYPLAVNATGNVYMSSAEPRSHFGFRPLQQISTGPFNKTVNLGLRRTSDDQPLSSGNPNQ
ncbi:uncharacterized protein DC041_0011665 [Schistosoma bovis]|uniref:Uncharacterized protein n=1 Tax=Schistosoma bovis TaxID=6184 RepID=A0A430QDF7_SCHBO|nr:uncharacterized protein DC041_0011665 [Schistosoma bovis]